jgi:hypothetical protein
LDIGEGYILSVSPADYSQSASKTSSIVPSSAISGATTSTPKESNFGDIIHASTAVPASGPIISARPISTLKLPPDCEGDKYPVVIVAHVFTAADIAQGGAQLLKELEVMYIYIH